MEFDIRQRIAILLREIRLDGEMSMYDVHKCYGISPSTLKAMERVEKPSCSISTLIKLLDKYGWYTYDFMKIVEDDNVNWGEKYERCYQDKDGGL